MSGEADYQYTGKFNSFVRGSDYRAAFVNSIFNVQRSTLARTHGVINMKRMMPTSAYSIS